MAIHTATYPASEVYGDLILPLIGDVCPVNVVGTTGYQFRIDTCSCAVTYGPTSAEAASQDYGLSYVKHFPGPVWTWQIVDGSTIIYDAVLGISINPGYATWPPPLPATTPPITKPGLIGWTGTGRWVKVEVVAGGDSSVDLVDFAAVVMDAAGSYYPFEFWYTEEVVSYSTSYSLELDSLQVTETIRFPTNAAMTYPAHPDQLDALYQYFEDSPDWAVAASAATLSASDGIGYAATQYAPLATVGLAGAVVNPEQTGGGTLENIHDNWVDAVVSQVTFAGDHFAPPWGDLNEWSGEVNRDDYPTPGKPTCLAYVEDAPSLKLGNCIANSDSGTLVAWYGTCYVTSKLSYDLLAFDQFVKLGTLEASATYIDTDFTLSGSSSVTLNPASWVSDPRAIGPCTADATDASLLNLKLPEADNKIQFHVPALDAISAAGYWSNYDDYGPVHYGLIKIGLQTPLGVQWCKDDQGATDPPSWWTVTSGSATLTRENTTELHINSPTSCVVTRALKSYDERWDPSYLTPPAGTDEADIWQYLFNWATSYESNKHLLEGQEVVGETPINAAGTVCSLGQPVDHYATGNLPASEDVWHWCAYQNLVLRVTSAHTSSWTLTVTVNYTVPTVTDNFLMDTEDRTEGFSVSWSSSSVTYSLTVPGSAAAEDLTIDLCTAGNPNLYRVTSIALSGFPNAQETVIEDINLTSPEDAWLECVYPRRMRYGGYTVEDCAEGTPLGTVRLPEEFSSRWLMGGYRYTQLPCDAGGSMGTAPYGLSFLLRRIPACGKGQDLLKAAVDWYNEIAGTWSRIEGVYGQEHIQQVSGVWPGAMADFVDANDDNVGPDWISDVPELLQFPITASDFMTGDRAVDGPDDIPVCLRVGSVSPAEGMCWANSGNAIVLEGKKFFYSPRLGLCGTTDGTTFTRDPGAQEYRLYEQDNPGVGSITTRLVDTRNSDAIGRIRFQQGINELKHTESGSSSPSNPDIDRDDFKSDILDSSETTDDLSFGLHHYQLAPTTQYVYVSQTAMHCMGCALLEARELWHLEAVPAKPLTSLPPSIHVFWRDVAPGAPLGAAFQIGTVSNGRGPRFVQAASGALWLFYIYAADPLGGSIDPNDGVYMVVVPDTRMTSWPPTTNTQDLPDAVKMFSGYSCYDLWYTPREGVLHFAGYREGNMYYVRSHLSGSGESSFTSEDAVELGTATEANPGITVLADGSVFVVYLDTDENVVVQHSINYTDWSAV